MRAFLVALQFLTRVPVRFTDSPSQQTIARSLLWYPLVGLLVGLMLCLFSWLLDGQAPLLSAALILSAWVSISGALHLDGLADCADAVVGGQGNRERMLAIMKDAAAGPMGVSAIVLVLMLKLGALSSAHDWPTLVLPPLLARGLVPLLFLSTPYVRRDGLGSAMAEHLPKNALLPVLGLGGLATLVATPLAAMLALIAAATVLWLLRAAAIRQLGGFTGDVAGALVELAETTILVALVLVSSGHST